MHLSYKQKIAICIGVLAPLVLGLLFYWSVVGRYGSTSVFSIIFGWQCLFLFGASMYLLFRAYKTKVRSYAFIAALLLFGIALVFTPSLLSQKTGRYILGDGTPAGPGFNCLVWENQPGPIGLYIDEICPVMSIPSFTKAWIDQNPANERNDAGASYYVTLVADEAVLLLVSVVAFRWWTTLTR